MIGYARVSTTGQDESLQISALKERGCDRVYVDHGASGATISRPAFDACLAALRRGDTLVVWRLDRVGRSTRHLLEIAEHLEQLGVHFSSLTESIATDTPGGRVFFTIMAAMAQMERELIQERTLAGLAEASKRGRHGGRPRTALTPERLSSIATLADAGKTVTEISKSLGIARSSVYRALAIATTPTSRRLEE